MHPPHRLLAALFVFAIAATAAACTKDNSATGADAKQALGRYATGFNALLDDPKRLIDGYFSAFPADHPPDPSPHPSLASASFATDKLAEARAAFADAARAAPPSLAALAPAAETALGETDKAVALCDAAYKYYQADGYKDDGGARGKQLHAQLIAARTQVHAAIRALDAGMGSIEDAQAADELAKRAGDKDYSYWFRFYDQQAKRVVKAVTGASSPAELAQVATAIKAMAPADDQLAAFVTAKGTKLAHPFRSYADDATAFQAEARKLARLIEAGKTFDDHELDDAARSVVGAYNNLITVANALTQVEAVDNLKDE